MMTKIPEKKDEKNLLKLKSVNMSGNQRTKKAFQELIEKAIQELSNSVFIFSFPFVHTSVLKESPCHTQK